MSNHQRYLIALNLANAVIGARRAHQLIQHFGSAEAVYRAGQSAWQAFGLTELAKSVLANPDWTGVDHAQAWADQPGQHLIFYDAPDYPPWLAQISDPPVLLYVQGDKSFLQRQQLAIVGSRHATPAGSETTFQLAASLARTGFVVVSGLALGIDAAAHRGALSQTGATVAVTGTGLDRVYPARHQDLADQIIASGCMVSEFPLGTRALGRHFPLRNRIISGLSRGVIVVEAALKSGSLITARQALEQGREVFAVPGSIHNTTSRGCHWLLRQGAKLVENIEDILEELDYSTQQKPDMEAGPSGSDPISLPAGDYQRVLDAVDYTPTSIDTIVNRSGLTPDAVCSMLLVLELYNVVRLSDGGRYSRSTGTSAPDFGVSESRVV